MPVADVAKAMGISRQWSHRWVRRFDEEGVAALEDRWSRPIGRMRSRRLVRSNLRRDDRAAHCGHGRLPETRPGSSRLPQTDWPQSGDRRLTQWVTYTLGMFGNGRCSLAGHLPGQFHCPVDFVAGVEELSTTFGNATAGLHPAARERRLRRRRHGRTQLPDLITASHDGTPLY